MQICNCLIGWSVPRALLGGMFKSARVREGFNGSISFGFGGKKKSIFLGTEQERLLKDKAHCWHLQS